MITHVRSVLAAFASLLLAPALSAQCGTVVTTGMSNTTWTLAGSPYCINATISVSHLTIQPGVEVRLAPGASLQVSTWMRALGTRTQPIRFHAQNLGAGRWGGIEFNGPVAAGNSSQLLHCIVTQAGNSGVRILDNDQVVLERCWIHDNTSPLDGGGVRVALNSGTVRILDCDIEGNRATRHGGGVSSVTTAGAALEMSGCRVLGNVANPSGGRGIFHGAGIRSSGNLQLSACLLSGNSMATYTCGGGIAARGGGLHADGGDVRVRNCSIFANTCRATTDPSTCGAQSGFAEGAGIYADATLQSLWIENTFVCCNTAQGLGPASLSRGSGIYSAAVSALIGNATIASNSDEGVRVASGNAVVRNSIVFFNLVSSIQGAATVSYSDIQGGWVGGAGNVRFNPAFVGAGCEPEHFALGSFSPCIDAGDPAVASNDACLPPAQGGPRNDMGAHGGPGSCGFAGPALSLCGAQTYGELRQGNDAMTLDWTALSTQAPFVGRLDLAQGAPSSPGLLLLSGNAAELALSGITLLVNAAGAGVVPIALNGAGAYNVTFALQIPALVGVPLFFQGFSLPASGVIRASNGLRLAPCH